MLKKVNVNQKGMWFGRNRAGNNFGKHMNEREEQRQKIRVKAENQLSVKKRVVSLQFRELVMLPGQPCYLRKVRYISQGLYLLCTMDLLLEFPFSFTG